MSINRKKILFVFGTRPEAIKMVPLINRFRENNSAKFYVKICVTGQHREMLNQVLDFFSIVADFDLNVMRSGQDLFSISSDILDKIKEIYIDFEPDLVMVQGDTSTAFLSALAAFYLRIKVAHVEAGLRSYRKYSPFPEEINRKLISVIADYHFVPTVKGLESLKKENILKNVFITGNTVIDALFQAIEVMNKNGVKEYEDFFNFLDFSKEIILVTGHRRENFGEPFRNICNAIRRLSMENVEIVYPVHFNPNVRKVVYKELEGLNNVHLIEPLNYPQLIWLMKASFLVLTDSGGIQEEAPSLGKPVIVMRETTERTEGVESGSTLLAGTDEDNIYNSVLTLLKEREKYNLMATITNPYGSGNAAELIYQIIDKEL